jgi:hypothetical protein
VLLDAADRKDAAIVFFHLLLELQPIHVLDLQTVLLF